MASFSVTNVFIANSRARSSEVNQNFTDVLGILDAHHHDPGIYTGAMPITNSGIATNAEILDTQLHSPFTRAGLISQAGVITAAAIAGLIQVKFGGSGADGALSISSGTTTLALGSATVFIKNYTSISITGTGALAFSGPSSNGTLIMLKATGNVTITSSANPAIDLRNIGATQGNDGLGFGCPAPSGGTAQATATANAVATADFNGGGAYELNIRKSVGARLSTLAALHGAFFSGGGGGAGAGGGGGTSGGTGGGGLFIQCGGDLNITSTINASGAVGGNSSGSTGSGTSAVGGRGGCANLASNWANFGSSASSVTMAGGGGGGGSIIILYNGTLVANTGTYTVTGGAAGTTGNGQAASAGADGYSLVAYNSELT